MKLQCLIWGILLMIAGIIGYVISAPKMNEFKSFWGQLAAGLDQSTAQQFQMWQTLYYASIVALVVGVVLIIVGAIQYATQK